MIARRAAVFVATLFLIFNIFALQTTALSQAGSTPTTGTVPATKATQSANEAGNKASAPIAVKGGASAADIAAAKSSGKVWVNTDTGVYHKSGRWYGKTKAGKFMTETEAKAAGYKEAKRQ